ncbi:hypothetical protein CJD36_007900 [Flavipsychrobacter stenotrophus]|uniref:Uncharacterized protein n=1 Tax=Flavipsychrobacter stenotrophus TaxID=2077091 RepID=A0A2S7SYD0_9BACT|nr:DUF5606 domain-containing protein [Flavipsychrobacter stenotrophus]PQJ11708.1 hypothetical protein CJD36_007900 [Flavipsychrobacter stenotrophus]
MQYKEIVSVTGLSGLYQLLTTKSDGAIVRNIGDKTTKFISARQHNVTPLESIEVYTIAENVRLHNVFQKMVEHETSIPPVDPKTATKEGVSGYFKSVFPEFDEERVYVSDMKKMLKWFELLKANDLLNFDAQIAEDNAANEEAAPAVEAPAAVAEPVAEEKPAKKAAKKKAVAEDGAEGEEKPAKKAAAKKKKTEE